MEECVFCKIVNKEIPCHCIYEDDLIMAFLDINPVTEGHTLVIPKQHFENIFDIDKNVLERVISVAQKISLKMKEELDIDGINLFQSNGSVAGQVVFHFHLHIIPRRKDDGVVIHESRLPSQEMNPEKIKELISKLRIE